MKKELLNDALNYIDNDLIEEYVKEKDALQAKARKKKKTRSIISIAACFVICFLSISIIVATSSDKKISSQIASNNKDMAQKIEQLQGIVDQLGAGILSTEEAMEAIKNAGIELEGWSETTAVISIAKQSLLEIYNEYCDQIISDENKQEATKLYEQALLEIANAKTIQEMNLVIEKFTQDISTLIAE